MSEVDRSLENLGRTFHVEVQEDSCDSCGKIQPVFRIDSLSGKDAAPLVTGAGRAPASPSADPVNDGLLQAGIAAASSGDYLDGLAENEQRAIDVCGLQINALTDARHADRAPLMTCVIRAPSASVALRGGMTPRA
jgi:hypothetical protein